MEVTYIEGRIHSIAKFGGLSYYRQVQSGRVCFVSPKATGRRRLHRDVYSSHWGAIPEGFVVHHVDGDGYNNEEPNLEAMSLEMHTSIHGVTEKTKKKMSVAKMGSKNPLFGHKHSEEAKKKMSVSSMGERHSDETKKKMSEARMGKNNPNWKGDDVTPNSLYKRKYRAAKRAIRNV